MNKLKSEHQMAYNVGYKICEVFLSAVFKVIGKFLRLLWTGIFTASKRYKMLGFFYVCLSIIGIAVRQNTDYLGAVVIIGLATTIISAMEVYRADAPYKEKVRLANLVFEEIGFKNPNGSYPLYLDSVKISEYATEILFRSMFPISAWQKKAEQLEIYLNTKIIDIVQDNHDSTITKLILESNPLPTDIPWDDNYINEYNNVLSIGVGHYGVVGMDLERNPHGFIAGESGSGKTTIMKAMVHQALHKNYDVVLIDFKRGVSFLEFEEYIEIHYEHESVKRVLQDMVSETHIRLDLFREAKVDNLNAYNRTGKTYLKRKIIFIDELAELLKTRDKALSNSIYDSLETLARISRATGIHLTMGIQRPDSTVINGQIKSNVSYRICGRFVDKEPSQIMLGNSIASELPNIKGRFIVKDEGFIGVQGFNFTNVDVDYRKEYFDYKDGFDELGVPIYELPTECEFDGASQEEIVSQAVDQSLSEAPMFDFSDFKN